MQNFTFFASMVTNIFCAAFFSEKNSNKPKVNPIKDILSQSNLKFLDGVCSILEDQDNLAMTYFNIMRRLRF
jgi:hypothetical protein